MMTNGQRSFISSAEVFFNNHTLPLKGRKGVWDWRAFSRRGTRCIIQPFWKHTLLHTSVLRLHRFCTPLQSFFYKNLPPGLHSLCITECLIWFLHPSIMNGQNGLVCCPHILPISLQLWFCSSVISQAWQLKGLDFPPWKLLCSQATGPSNDGKLCLWHVNYGAKILPSSCVSFLEAYHVSHKRFFCAIAGPLPHAVSLTIVPIKY